jgi:tripartite-type tricarboxylate transporter receptor subunit TctC
VTRTGMFRPRHRTAVPARRKKASRRHFLALTACAVALTSVCPDAMAQTYPSRPITMVVAFGAGGPSDIIARILAEGMRRSLGQPVVIENVAGASGTIGVGRVARAVPDGYTLVLGNWATHVLNGPMFALQYDLEKDFEQVSLVSSDPLIIVARKTMPARDLKEFIAWLKTNPNSATQGTTGAGGISTVGGLFFQKETATRFSSCRPDRFHDRHGRQFSSSGPHGHH